MYYKVIHNDVVIDALENPSYVKWHNRHQTPIRCIEKEAIGVISSDCSTIYHLSGRNPFPAGEYETVELVKIYEEEYLAIKEGITESDPEDTTPEIPEDITDETQILTRAELTAKVAELEEQNTMLMECLLEMSETVYA